MAISTIVTGGAHLSESGKVTGVAGDQKQSGTPDYSGEVSMRRKNENAFRRAYLGFTLYRPKDPDQSSMIANLMIRACNNPHIGYSQDSRQEIFTYGVDSSKDINCDCSSLVCYCVDEAMGLNINTTTEYLDNALQNSNMFMSPIAVSSLSFESNAPFNGDVLVKKGGHTEIVVAGNPRKGNDNEITAGTWVGDGNAVKDYRNQYIESSVYHPRRTTPDSSANAYYNQDYGVSANGSYAWGRFSEVMQSPCNVSKGAPRKWYIYNEDGYKRGTTPLPGAIMCFTNIYDVTDPGVVCIVEEVNTNSINISWRNPKTERFEFATFVKDSGSWDLDFDGDGKKEYLCQGFIYNPAVNLNESIESAAKSFIDNAKRQIGNNGSYVEKYTTLVPKRDAWSAGFIVAVAAETGDILDKVIPNTYACSNIGRLGVNRDMGTWLNGPAIGGNAIPHEGDLILLRTTALKKPADYRYEADKAGIVIKVGPSNGAESGKNQTTYSTIETVIGDWQETVKKVTFKTDSMEISGYFRPNWEKTDGYSHEVKQIIELDGLYTEGTSMEDAAIRDLRYVEVTSTGLEPSIESTGITLCAINYTGMLANFYTAFAESGNCPGYSPDQMVDSAYDSSGYNEYDATVDPTDTSSVVMTVYRALTSYLDNSAGAIGILGNIQAESGFDITVVNSIGATGLCQWYKGRAENMKNYCLDHYGVPFDQCLSGQIDFLINELNSGYYKVANTCRSVPDTLDGAKISCDTFMRQYEIPGNYGVNGPKRAAFTESFWNQIRLGEGQGENSQNAGEGGEADDEFFTGTKASSNYGQHTVNTSFLRYTVNKMKKGEAIITKGPAEYIVRQMKTGQASTTPRGFLPQ